MRIHSGDGIVNVSWEQGSEQRRLEIQGPNPKHPKEAHLRSCIVFEDEGEDGIVYLSWKAGRSEADQELDSGQLRDIAKQLLRMADKLDGKPLPALEDDPLLNDFRAIYDPKV